MRHLKTYKIFESNLKSEAPRAPYLFGKEIFPKEGKAYHLTPDINVEEIKRTGLKAKTENKLENHPERIYLFLNPESKSSKYLAAQLWNQSRQKGRIQNYYLLEIDLTQLPGHKYFSDPSSGIASWIGIYTEQSIPPSAIKVKEKIPVGSLPKVSDEDREGLKDETYRKTGFWPEKKEKMGGYKPKEKTPEEIKKEKEWNDMMADMIDKIPDDAKISIDPKRLEGE
jgi:hypothetical protein